MRVSPARLSAFLLWVLFSIALFRAATQSFTIDEARTFRLFADPPWAEMAKTYDACNHVLHTVLMKIFRQWLGTSELVLRLPSLLGCAIYFLAVYRLCGLLFGQSYRQTLAVATLTAHPLLFDFYVAARGYGLAIAIFTWCLLSVLEIISSGATGPRLFRAGVLAGLSLAANLVMALPLTALALCLALFAVRQGFIRKLHYFAGPATTTSFVFLVLPLARSESGNFYVGTDTWLKSISLLWESSFRRGVSPDLFSFLRTIPPETIAIGIALLLLPSLAALFAALRSAQPTFGLCAFAVTGGTLGGSLLLLASLNRFAGLPFPYFRTGLYLIPLTCLLFVCALQLLNRWSAGQAASSVAMALLSVFFLSQIEVRYFYEWRFDAQTASALAAVHADVTGRRLTKPVTIGISWVLEESAMYYQKRQKLGFVKQLINNRPGTFPAACCDYFVLIPDERGIAAARDRMILQSFSPTGVVVAAGS